MNKEFMQVAIDTAIDNIKINNGGPFGAVIVKDGKLIAKSPNTVTTSNDPTAHAEINAIRLACK
ncbi:MAG: deaminase, partial [Bacteroidales bacterium]|nr:deaminase [Bacteroidales bacterium]